MIRVKTIVEMLGAPKMHVESTLKNYVKKLKEDELEILNEHYEEAKQQEKLFSAFAELDIKFKSLSHLLDFCLDAMPSSIEIIEPEELKLPSRDFTNFLNDFQARLHEVDMLIKSAAAQKRVLDTNAVNIFNNFILYILKQGPKKIGEISTLLGINEGGLKPFLKKLIENNTVVEKEEVYQIK